MLPVCVIKAISSAFDDFGRMMFGVLQWIQKRFPIVLLVTWATLSVLGTSTSPKWKPIVCVVPCGVTRTWNWSPVWSWNSCFVLPTTSNQSTAVICCALSPSSICKSELVLYVWECKNFALQQIDSRAVMFLGLLKVWPTFPVIELLPLLDQQPWYCTVTKTGNQLIVC